MQKSHMSSSDEMEIADDDVGQPHGTSARKRRDRLLKKEMGNQKAIDYNLLAELGQQERMTAIIGEDTPWSRLFEMTYASQYRLITVEFLSTFRFRPQPPDFQPQPEFGSVLGLYTEEETHMPIYTTAIHTADDAVVSAWWPRIGDDAFDRSAWVTRIRDPLIRYLHRSIASSVTGRGMSQEWCTSHDLFFLYCILSGRPCNLAHLEPAGMEAFHPVRLDRRTVLGMRIAQTFPRLRLRFSLVRGVIWQPGPNDLHYIDEDPMHMFPQPQPQQPSPPPPPPPPPGEGEPYQDVPHQHPERIYRAVRLPARVEAMLQGIADSTQQLVQQQAHMQQQ
ncbi:hypothetical protein R6Q59_010766 [Mikania micrantha]